MVGGIYVLVAQTLTSSLTDLYVYSGRKLAWPHATRLFLGSLQTRIICKSLRIYPIQAFKLYWNPIKVNVKSHSLKSPISDTRDGKTNYMYLVSQFLHLDAEDKLIVVPIYNCGCGFTYSITSINMHIYIKHKLILPSNLTCIQPLLWVELAQTYW